MTQQSKKNPAALAGATEAEEIKVSPKAYLWRNAFASMSLGDRLNIRPEGWFHIRKVEGQTVIDIYRNGSLDEVVTCISLGHANRVRQKLTDMGMGGLAEGEASWPNP